MPAPRWPSFDGWPRLGEAAALRSGPAAVPPGGGLAPLVLGGPALGAGASAPQAFLGRCHVPPGAFGGRAAAGARCCSVRPPVTLVAQPTALAPPATPSTPRARTRQTANRAAFYAAVEAFPAAEALQAIWQARTAPSTRSMYGATPPLYDRVCAKGRIVCGPLPATPWSCSPGTSRSAGRSRPRPPTGGPSWTSPASVGATFAWTAIDRSASSSAWSGAWLLRSRPRPSPSPSCAGWGLWCPLTWTPTPCWALCAPS